MATGCQRMKEERTVTIAPGGSHALEFSAPSYSQKVTVTVSPSGGSVSAYLVKTSEFSAVDSALDVGKPPPADAVFARKESKDQAEEYSLEATIPAKTEYTLLLRAGPKGADVKVKVVGR
jgi:hypothetical protein